ncbi:MAG: cysteine--tRNA ligase [Candidatus Pacebacteria bacterium]|nr:cysteine--tRNA ligase [Candidatus Paceibacterota bacterium]
MTLTLSNTLSGKKEEFIPIKKGQVGMYNCGPTVYNYPHIGNLRAFLLADILRRTLEWNGYKVKQILNITDVGHLTDDASNGEDKMEKAARLGGKTAKEISEFYTQAFFDDLKKMNIETEGTTFPRATAHIQEQIDLIKTLEKKGYTYKTSDGIYFDTSKFPDYGKLGNINLKGLEEGARVEKNTEKKNLTDFALWKFSKPEEKRQQEWESPWGVGFPGWHIECSAMSMKYLGETFDIHTGGIDHIPVHHNNEIAQSTCATGKPYAHYWLHNAHVNISGGEKMAKSAGNFIRLQTLIDAKIHPLSYRYYLLGAHYSTPMAFTMEAVEGAQSTLENIVREVKNLGEKVGKSIPDFMEKFEVSINNDLGTAEALALLHSLLVNKDVKSEDKLATIKEFDKVLGLNLIELAKEMGTIPKEIWALNEKREVARKEKDWKKSDELRAEIEKLGYKVLDGTNKSVIERSLASLIV